MRVPLPAAFLAAPIAHRGLHDRGAGRIENSLSAIRAARDAGYGIEIDLQRSSDGVAMVFHDDTLDRLTDETGPVRARSAAELSHIRLKDSTDTIPTFAEVLAEVAGRVPLLVEIKDQSLVMGETDGRLEAAAARVAAGGSVTEELDRRLLDLPQLAHLGADAGDAALGEDPLLFLLEGIVLIE